MYKSLETIIREMYEKAPDTAAANPIIEMSCGDTARKKTENVARPMTMSANTAGKLAKQGEIKTKIIDEDNDDVPFKGPYSVPGVRKDRFGNVIKSDNVARYLARQAMRDLEKKKTIAKSDALKTMGENTVAENRTPALDAVFHGHAGNYEKIYNHHGDKIHGMMQDIKKERNDVIKAAAGSSRAALLHDMALKAYNSMYKKTDEEVEGLDELSKGTLGRYVNKAADRMSTQGVTAGLKIAADEKSKKNFDTIAKRQKGITTAVSKLTKEEQEFVDLLNTSDLSEDDFKPGRGRPAKIGSPAYIRQQANKDAGKGVEEPLALGMQLRKVITVDKPVTFANGETSKVHPRHVAAFDNHMASRRTTQEKAAFQKNAHKSHADFVKHVSMPVPKESKDTGEIIKYR